MRIVLQRVSQASVRVHDEITGSIQQGLLLLVGFHPTDTKNEVDWCCRKLPALRVFPDEEGKMNRSVQDIGGGMLVISQFTLYGRVEKGTRPGFTDAARPEIAEPLYDYMLETLRRDSGVKIQQGVFAAMMDVSLVNEGPVTLIMERMAD